MINENSIKIINKEIDKGNKFFYFDIRSMELVLSSSDNKGSFYDSNVSDCIEIYIPYHTTFENLVSLLKYYNEMR